MPLTPDEARAKTAALYQELSTRREEVSRYDRYFRGEHRLVYASDAWRKFHQDRYRDFSDNWCGVVASSPSERITVNGFRVGDDTETVDDAERGLWRDWQFNEMDAQSSQGFLESIKAKRSFVLVWGDSNDEPVMTWERPDQVIVDYDPAGRRLRRAALKAWVEDDREYATLYMPDEVWKFQRPSPTGKITPVDVYGRPILTTAQGGWQAREVDRESWPLRNPFGLVPMVELPNRPVLGGEPLSDIAGTIAMQDAINLLWAYLFNAADYASMPARVVMGQEPPKMPVLDSNGVKIGEKAIDNDALAAGRMLWLSGEHANIAQWDAAKLDVFTEVINRAVRHIAAQTRTPVHYIVGELTNVNGETLIAGEAGLVKKVEEAQLFFSPPLREVFRLAALVRGNDELAERCRLGTVVWANTETRSHTQQADALLKWRDVGFPFRYLAEKSGLSPAEIERVVALRKQELEDAASMDMRAIMGAEPPVPPDADAA